MVAKIATAIIPAKIRTKGRQSQQIENMFFVQKIRLKDPAKLGMRLTSSSPNFVSDDLIREMLFLSVFEYRIWHNFNSSLRIVVM